LHRASVLRRRLRDLERADRGLPRRLLHARALRTPIARPEREDREDPHAFLDVVLHPGGSRTPIGANARQNARPGLARAGSRRGERRTGSTARTLSLTPGPSPASGGGIASDAVVQPLTQDPAAPQRPTARPVCRQSHI